MANRCLLYYTTDRSQFRGDESYRRRALLANVAEAARAGVDYIQLREKDLSARELEKMAREVVAVVRENSPSTRVLINSRTDVALAAGADGVHLRADDVAAHEVRQLLQGVTSAAKAGSQNGPLTAALKRCATQNRTTSASSESPAVTKTAAISADRALTPGRCLIAASCHSIADVFRAESEGADFAVFAPVFGKRSAPGTLPTGLTALREACQAKIPVLALGGVTIENAASCLNEGAAGVAGIRLFQENKIEDVVRALRAL